MKAKIFILVSLFIVSLSCSRNKKTIDTEVICMSPNSHTTQEIEWIRKIVDYGDTIAYQTLYYHYYDDSRMDVLLGYAIIMANKYDYPAAYYDVFDFLIGMLTPPSYSKECNHDFGFHCLDNKTQQLALTFFRQAIYKGNIDASERLLNEFDKGKPFAIEELYLDIKLIDKARQNVEN